MVQMKAGGLFYGIKIWHFSAFLLFILLGACPALCEDSILPQDQGRVITESPKRSANNSNFGLSLKRRSPLPQAGGCANGKERVKGKCVNKCKQNQKRNKAGNCVKKNK
ncbi:hypothetical protein PTTG_29250 [Puccinia triticina 1-1 BBBD Race 1]|uniref:Secreted protein n=2 Tax=Puccinia triticina TaxID=208348 RepID=A0A180G5K1_PUCT1|nr:uncharacterized protein PtA15_4A188 [Puccinia triticina]OAV87880.1 hypothetical protein PTTG_29250 [Puccinia triticina 1-1 BBBD Race 1]WAQ83740.1 hypothetical protein PtA15_4A188 [Puccinia triticina]WAR54582.1 hypothetical protein PtB15_4B199 [Puccinia triticina]